MKINKSPMKSVKGITHTDDAALSNTTENEGVVIRNLHYLLLDQFLCSNHPMH